MSRFVVVVLAFLIVVLVTTSAVAQVEQATVVGTVTDASGAVIPGAKVTVKNVATGVTIESQTNALGIYRVPYLHPGKYEVAVESPGFKKARVSDITLTVGLTATVDVTLEVGAVDTEVTVAATAVQLEAQTATLGNVVSSSQILQLPLLGRNPYSLVALAPGVVPKGSNASGVRPLINGGRSNTSEVLLDGAESRNTTTMDIAYTPPLEAVQEFKVLTNNFSSEFGRSGGGVLTAATRSGTNELHGSLYWFIRNDKLNANSWKNNRVGLSKSPYRRNEYGFSVGGPVFLPKVYDGRNKTFFFVNWEQVPQRSPDDIVGTVPTELERAGDFSQTTSKGKLIRMFDPQTTRPDPAHPGKYIRDQFPSNMIPASRFDPIAAKVIGFYPIPNRTTETENFVKNGTRKNDVSKLFLRFDHQLGMKHRLFLSYGWQNNDRLTRGSIINIAYPEEGTNGQKAKQKVEQRMATLSDTVTFSPQLVGEFRATLVRNLNTTHPRSLGYDFTELGFPESLKAHAKVLMFPRFEPSDVDSLGTRRAGFFRMANWNTGAQGHFTWIRDTHSLKWGAEYLFLANNVTRPESGAGRYQFGRSFTQGPDPTKSSSTSGYGVATLLLGLPTGGRISDDPSLAASQRFYTWYIQDDWRVLPKLTLNLGVRWEYQTPWIDRFDHLAFFNPDATDPLTGQKGLLQFVAQDIDSRYQSDPDKNNFAPRVGLAWEVAPKTVIRAGYGMFFYPGSGGIGGGISDLGSGWLVNTYVYLGQPPAAPNTPPPGASLAEPFKAGFFTPPSRMVGSSINSQFRDWVTPYNQQWNFSIQRMMPGDFLVEAAYVGSRGQRIWINRNQSAVSTKYLSLGPALDELVPNPYYGIITTGSLSAAKVRRSQLLKPYNHYSNVNRFRDAVGDSVYHGFTLRVDRQMKNGLRFQAAYTVSKMIDNVQERFGSRSKYIDPNNLRLSRSISEWDRPQVLVLNFVYELPFGPGKKWARSGLSRWVVGGWQISGITTFEKGEPVVIKGPSNTRLPGVSAAAVRLSSGILPKSEQTLDRWFDTSAFAPAPTYSLGNDSRTEPSLRGPGVKKFDLAVMRNIRFKERYNLQIRAEFFNAFNTPQFADPNGSVTSKNFGRILSARDARQIQMGLRLTF